MLCLAGGGPAFAAGDEILAKLDLTPAAARAGVLDSLGGGTPYNDAAYKAFKALPGLARETAVRAGLAWIRSYVAGAEFQAAYARVREQEKPLPPETRPAADEQVRKMRADLEKSIAEMRKNMAAMDAETRKAMEAAIQQMRAQMEQMEKDPQQRDLMRQSLAMAGAEDRKRHEEALREWERKYPPDPRTLIRRRIQEFLAASAGVDFAAKLLPRDGKMVFASQEYEAKPAEWKLCFRAGREATGAARAVAAAWLAELEKK